MGGQPRYLTLRTQYLKAFPARQIARKNADKILDIKTRYIKQFKEILQRLFHLVFFEFPGLAGGFVLDLRSGPVPLAGSGLFLAPLLL